MKQSCIYVPTFHAIGRDEMIVVLPGAARSTCKLCHDLRRPCNSAVQGPARSCCSGCFSYLLYLLPALGILLRISNAQPEGRAAFVGDERCTGRASTGSPATGICSPVGIGGRALVSALRVDCRLCRAASSLFDVSVCSRCTKCLSYISGTASLQPGAACSRFLVIHCMLWGPPSVYAIRETSASCSDQCQQHTRLHVPEFIVGHQFGA